MLHQRAMVLLWGQQSGFTDTGGDRDRVLMQSAARNTRDRGKLAVSKQTCSGFGDQLVECHRYESPVQTGCGAQGQCFDCSKIPRYTHEDDRKPESTANHVVAKAKQLNQKGAFPPNRWQQQVVPVF